MYCLKCGREIPDGELFCRECAKKPIERQHPEVRAAKPQPVQPEEPASPAQRKVAPEEKPARRRNRLLLPLILCCLLLAALAAFTAYSYRQIALQKANYRVREADLKLRETELSDLQQNYEQTQQALSEAQSTIEQKNAEIAELNQRMLEWESASSQNEYDAETARKTIETLHGENETLSQKNETLTQEKAALSEQLEAQKSKTATVQEELDNVNYLYAQVKEKANFMDSYVVFVCNNGTKYYHKYDCSNFTKSNFWAYSRKLAENYGYTACPVCGG